jgi:hypothetical protein
MVGRIFMKFVVDDTLFQADPKFHFLLELLIPIRRVLKVVRWDDDDAIGHNLGRMNDVNALDVISRDGHLWRRTSACMF